MIELELDFSEEDVKFADRDALLLTAKESKELTDSLAASFKAGNAIKNGVPVAIAGPPNVGKSTLLNALLNDDRAIVSEIAGTTRDAIEDTIIIEGALYRFIDTAGIRETKDTIENLGIERTFRKIEQASVILFMAESDDTAEAVNQYIRRIRNQPGAEHKPLILIINKKDRADEKAIRELENAVIRDGNLDVISISALKGENIKELTDLLSQVVNIGSVRFHDNIITNIRHYHALQAASLSLERVIEGISDQIPSDLLAQDIRETVMILGEITGEVTTDEILGNIFKNFCIGK